MTKVKICISDGCLMSVSSTDEIEYVLLDFDALRRGIPCGDEFQCQDYIQSENEMLAVIINENERHLKINNEED